MTDLLTEYRKHRDQGHTHWAACIALARRFDLDKLTVNRVIERAERAEARAGTVRKFHDHLASPRPSPRKKPQTKETVMADGHASALRALAAMEQDAIQRARAAGAQARAAASQPGQKATTEPGVLSIPINGPYRPPDPGELAAMQAGAAMLAGLQQLAAKRWSLSMPVMGGDR
jgi:hypothetical protein